MSDTEHDELAELEAKRPPRRWWRRLLGALIALVLLVIAAAAILDTSIGHRFVTDRIAALKPANGLRFSVGRIEGCGVEWNDGCGNLETSWSVPRGVDLRDSNREITPLARLDRSFRVIERLGGP